jgi:hypothetical protein
VLRIDLHRLLTWNLLLTPQTVYVASYITQTVTFCSAASSVSGTTSTFTAGETRLVSAATYVVPVFKAGDALCGLSGTLSVVGEGGNHERDWVPARLSGTTFILPVNRNNPQTIFVMAMGQAAAVTLKFGTTDVETLLHVPPWTARMFVGVSRAGRTITLISTAPIIGSLACGSPGSTGNDPLAEDALPIYGWSDYCWFCLYRAHATCVTGPVAPAAAILGSQPLDPHCSAVPRTPHIHPLGPCVFFPHRTPLDPPRFTTMLVTHALSQHCTSCGTN